MAKATKPNPTSIYIIQETYFEYDDSNYHSSEGGRPVEAFLNIKNAEEACLKQTISSLRDSDCPAYSMDMLPFGKEILEEFGIHDNGSRYDYEFPDKMSKLFGKCSKEQQIRLIDDLQISLYSVVEVKIGS